MNDGFMGKILWANLSREHLWEEPLDDDLKFNYIGGYGIALKLIYSRQPARISALDQRSITGVMTGPLTGSGAVIGSRFTVFGKSPLTGTWGDANSGGYFGPYLKKSGYDGIFVTGASERPVYILIDEGKARVCDAGHLWGRSTFDTEDILREEHGKDIHVACIGPSGEKGCKFAAVMTDKGRAAARFGLGAIWGAKNLKAIAVRGNLPVQAADNERLNELRVKYTNQIIKEHVGAAAAYQVGTPGYTAVGALNGDSPVKNWGGASRVDFTEEEAERLRNDKLFAYRTRKYGCFKCPISCSGLVKVPEGPYKVEETHQPEYETMAAFGSNCGNSNLESIIAANDICNRYGIDTISAGCAIAFAIECYENGIINEQDTGGIKLTWGNHEAIVELTRRIAAREGIGDILAEGIQAAAEKFGNGADSLAVHILGEGVAMHDPRFEPAMAVIYKMFPGKHIQASQFCTPPELPEAPFMYGGERDKAVGRGKQLRLLECICNMVNSSGACLFGHLSNTYESLGEFLQAVTGKEWSYNKIIETGERISNLRQMFNIREGVNPVTAPFPNRIIGVPPLDDGPTKGFTVQMDTILSEYLDSMGWTPGGVPKSERLIELGLEDICGTICQNN